MTSSSGRPALKPGCRLSANNDTLLIPEGVLRLQGPARHILQICDGKHTIDDIVTRLLADYPAADRTKVSEETSSFLAKLVAKGVLEWV
jgi:pyrroloquinoline quinone biosynthesis protein D